MRKMHSNKINKFIICIVAAILLCNFVMPNFVYASTDTNEGGLLFKGLVKLVTYLCDTVMQWLQDSFISEEPIDKEDGTYNFQYTPAKIFSGTVPALDINFIEPSSKVESLAETEFSRGDFLQVLQRSYS